MAYHIIWNNCTQQQCNEIEKIQIEAGRIITGATEIASSQARGTNSTSFLTHVRNEVELGPLACEDAKIVEIDKLYRELGWLKLSDRMDHHKLFLFFKMNHGLSHLYLSTLLPPHVGDVSFYRLRNAENYVGIHANTHAYAESFLPSTLKACNNLPEAVRSSDTLAPVKHLTLDTPKENKYHCSDSRTNLTHTSQNRM